MASCLISPPTRDEYFRMKLQWRSVSPEQERRNSLLHGYRGLIGRLRARAGVGTWQTAGRGQRKPLPPQK